MADRNQHKILLSTISLALTQILSCEAYNNFSRWHWWYCMACTNCC